MAEGADSVTVDVLAAWLGVTDRTVRDLAARGVVVKAGRGAYRLEASIRAYCGHLREIAAARGEHAPGVGLASERAREARERADNLALRNQQLRRELVPAADVERAWIETLRLVRSRMLAIPSRAQQHLPHLTAHDVATIDREVRDALTEAGRDGA